MRRRGIPLIGAGAMMGGFGGGMGSPLLTALLSGGLGYVVGSGSGQRQMTEQLNVRIGQLEQLREAADLAQLTRGGATTAGGRARKAECFHGA